MCPWGLWEFLKEQYDSIDTDAANIEEMRHRDQGKMLDHAG